MKKSFFYFNIIIVFLLILQLNHYLCADKKKKKNKKKYERDHSVIIMNDNNFNNIINSIDILVLFYKKNSTNSKQFMPVFTQAALTFRNNKPRLNFGKIECDENPQTNSKEGITQHPTIKYYKKGKSFIYYGTSDIEGILKFMWKNTLPPISDLMTLAAISDFKNTHEITAIYFGTDKNILNIINEHALDDADIFYGNADFERAYEVYGVKKNTIILFKKYGEERTEISGKLSKDGIINFITQNSVDKILEGTERTAKLIWGLRQPGLFLFVDPKDEKINFLRRTFNEVAEKIGNRIKIVIMGLESPMEQKINTLTLVKPQDLPTIRIYDPRKGPTTFHLFNKRLPMNTTNIIEFTEKFLAGRLQYYKLSEEIPKVQRGYMREIVGITFDKEIFYNHQHVLVVFYHPYKAPLFQHAIDFMEEFARKIRNNEVSIYSNKMKDKDGKDINKKVLINRKINVGMLDLSRNDPDMKIDYGQLPSIQFFLDEDKNHPFRFDGELTEQNLLLFMEKHLIDKEKEKEYEKNNESDNEL